MTDIEAAIKAIEEEFSEASKFDAPELHASELSKNSLELIVGELRMSLLRDARESFDFDRWETLFSKIEAEAATSAEIAYERLQCLLTRGLRRQAREHLEQFPSYESARDRLMKAAVLSELDSLREARREGEIAIHEIRKALNSDPENIRLLSLEGWALYQLLHTRTTSDFKEFREIERRTWKRFRELRLYDSDPTAIKSEMEEALRGRKPEIAETKSIKDRFDPLSKSESHHFQSDYLKDFIPAFAYVRLFEKGMIPLRLPVFATAGKELRAALEWKYSVSSHWSHLLLIRRGHYAPLKEETVLTRSEVALLPRDTVEEVFEVCSQTFDDLSGTGWSRTFHGDLHVLAVAVEILSRVAFRLDEAQLKNSFGRCKRLYESTIVMANDSLEEACSNWFRRLLLAAPEALEISWIAEILQLDPFAGPSSEPEPEHPRFRDPFDFVEMKLLESLIEEDEVVSEIQTEIESLFHQLNVKTGRRFKRTLGRLVKLRCSTLLFDEKQDADLVDWIWFEDGKQRDLPLTPGFDHSVIFFLPSPEKIDLHRRWKESISQRLEKVLVQATEGEIDLERIQSLFLTIDASTRDFRAPRDSPTDHLSWNKTESKQLLLSTLDLWDASLPTLKKLEERKKQPIIFDFSSAESFCDQTVSLLADAILPGIGRIAERDLARTEDLFSDVSELGYGTIEAELSLARLKPELLTRIEEKIGRYLESESGSHLSDAVSGVRRWGEISKHFSSFPEAPSRLVEQIAEGFAFRLPMDAKPLFDFLSACFAQNLTLLSADHVDLVLRGLPGWESATRPENNTSERRAKLDERYRLSRLVDQMLKTKSLKSNKILSRVSKKLAKDALPEVREPFIGSF